MDKTLKRILAITCLLLAIVKTPALAGTVNIIIPDNNPAMLNLARAAQHALLQLESSSQVSILTPITITAASNDALLIIIGDDLWKWAGSPANSHRNLLFFYVSSVNYNANQLRSTQTALFRDQPLCRQLHLAAMLLPNAHRALVMRRPEQFMKCKIDSIRSGGLTVDFRSVQPENNWVKLLSQWMTDNDVLIGVEDQELYNSDTIRSILLTTYRHGKVLIGPSRGFVEAGSLASTYTSPEHYLRQLQLMVQFWQQTGSLPAPQFPLDYGIVVNRQVANSLGLSLPDDNTLLQQLQQRLQVVENCNDGC